MLKRFVKSISALAAGQVLNVVGNLVLVPLFLSRWSTAKYGEWMALCAVVAYFSLTDLGMNSAAANAMIAAYARNDLARYRYLQSSAMAFYLGLAGGISLLSGILLVRLPVATWIGIREVPARLAGAIIWLLAVRLLWQMPAAQLGSVYRTMGNLACTEWLTNLQATGILVVTVAVLWFHGDMLSLAMWSVAPMILVALGAWLSLRRSHPQMLPKLSEARLAGLRELLNPSLLFGLIMLSMALTLQAPVLLVSRVLGGAAVALLVTTRTLANVIRQAIGPIQIALWPELTRLDAVGAEAALRLGHRLLTVGSVALCAAFGGALWFEGAGVMAVWTRGKLSADPWLLRYFLIAMVLQAPWLASSLFTTASNRHRRLAQSYAISAILALAAIALLLRPCGLAAVPLGGLIGEALASYHFVIKDACGVLKEDYPRFVARLWAGVGVISLAGWSAGYLGSSLAIGPAPLRWLEVGISTTTSAALAAWTVGLQRGDRQLLTRWGHIRWVALRAAQAELAA